MTLPLGNQLAIDPGLPEPANEPLAGIALADVTQPR